MIVGADISAVIEWFGYLVIIFNAGCGLPRSKLDGSTAIPAAKSRPNSLLIMYNQTMFQIQ